MRFCVNTSIAFSSLFLTTKRNRMSKRSISWAKKKKIQERKATRLADQIRSERSPRLTPTPLKSSWMTLLPAYLLIPLSIIFAVAVLSCFVDWFLVEQGEGRQSGFSPHDHLEHWMGFLAASVWDRRGRKRLEKTLACWSRGMRWAWRRTARAAFFGFRFSFLFYCHHRFGLVWVMFSVLFFSECICVSSHIYDFKWYIMPQTLVLCSAKPSAKHRTV